LTLLRRLAVPLRRFGCIRCQPATTILVQQAEPELREGMALIGSLAIPFHRLRVVLRHATALIVGESEACLRFCVSLIGSLAISFHRLRVVLRHTSTLQVH
jgi:hypothetical protein